MLVLDPGNLDETLVAELIKRTKVKIFLVTQLQKSRLTYKRLGIDCNSFEDIESEECHQDSNLNIDLERLYREIIGNINTAHILDRRFLPRSSLHNMHYVLYLIDKYSRFIVSFKVESYFILSAPHSIKHWVFARCLELIKNTKINYFNLSLLPWRVSHIKGVISKSNVELNQLHQRPLDSDLWERFCHLKRSNRSDVMPSYERKARKKSRIGRFIYLVMSKRNYMRPDILFNTVRCHFAYQKYCISTLPSRYIVMFLHFQPERTTAPDGDLFANQLLSATLVKKALPDGIELVVKEHPSTFSRGSDIKHRWPGFYQDFIKIGASFVPVDYDSYKLIDNSFCVASVGGTVVAEAILRNKPAIYFGLGAVYPVVGKPLHRYSNINKLSSFFKTIESLSDEDYNVTKNAYKKFIDEYTVSAEISKDATFDELTTLKYRLPAIYNYLQILLTTNQFKCSSVKGK